MASATEGTFPNGMPYLKLGQGPPLVVAPGLTAEHKNPTGRWRKMSLAWCAPFAEHFTVYLLQRKPGLPPGTTLSDIAADYAEVIEQEIGAPVRVHGTSTGGSVAQQLAVDRPELVDRMVVAAAACRLSGRGRELTAELVRLTELGEDRSAMGLLAGTQVPRPFRPLAHGVGWVMGGFWAVDDPSDMVVTATAELPLDLEKDLARVTAPTLVLGGTADVFYDLQDFRRTAEAIPDGRAVIFEGRSHMFVAGSKVPAAVGLGFLLGG
ncbi:MAG TPA: alpha/beta hydrolase [Nocardioidaceae bacterium]|nr:alpha/beta hydrolase [Nocardioidaceae bacterium]